jgi:hypothetical protein
VIAWQAAAEGSVADDELHRLIQSKLTRSLEQAASDHLLSSREEDRFGELYGAFGLSRSDIESVWYTIEQARILRSLDEGSPTEIKVHELAPRLEADEFAVWAFTTFAF